MLKNPENWTSHRIPNVTNERLRRLAKFKRTTKYALIDRVTILWENNLLETMMPAERRRYLAGTMEFEEAQRIAVRQARRRNCLPPPPDNPVQLTPPPVEDDAPARTAEA